MDTRKLPSVAIGIEGEKREPSAPWYGAALSRAVARMRGLRGDSAVVPGVIFVVLALSFGAIGYYEYRTQAEVMRARAERDIGAIADLKTQQITQWLAERRAHASSMMADPALAADVRELLRQGTTETPVRAHIRARLEAAQKAYGYEAVVLLDRDGHRHVLSGAVESLPARELELAREAMRRKDVVLSELHWDQSAGRRFVSLEIFAPLLIADPKQAAVGAVYLDADVSKDLYPLIQGWLTPGGSAEAQLIRREGDEIVYLNELRYRPQASLSLRTPLGEQQVGALALLKGEGTYRGLDYRGVEVLAAARAVPGTAWMMVARVDAAEVYAPIVALATRVSAVVGVLIAIGGVGTGLWWRNHRARHDLDKYRLQVEKHALSMHYAHLTRNANDIILLMDGAGQIVDANDRAVEAYGYPRPQLLGMALAALQAPATATGADGERGKVQWTSGGRIYEALHRRGDGKVFPVEVSARLFEISGKSYRQAIIRDITERKRAEEALRRREQEYMALAEHSPDIIARFDRACRYLYVNAPIEVATGLERARFIGKSNAELGLPPELSEPWERAVEATFRTAREQRFDFSVSTPGGELLYEARMVPEFGPAGEVQTVLCVSRDATARAAMAGRG